MGVSKEAEDRRNEILDKAQVLFITKGYSKATVNDIIQSVGIAKGTFYYYFKSKEEVMDAIVTRFIDGGVAVLNSIASDPKLTALEKGFQMIMIQTVKDDKKEEMIEQFHQVKNEEMHQRSLVESIVRVTPIITKVIEQGIEEGVFNTPYPKEVVEVLFTSGQILFDEGFFNWTKEEFFQKAKGFCYIAETLLGAKIGTFSYVIEMLEKTMNNDISNE